MQLWNVKIGEIYVYDINGQLKRSTGWSCNNVEFSKLFPAYVVGKEKVQVRDKYCGGREVDAFRWKVKIRIPVGVTLASPKALDIPGLMADPDTAYKELFVFAKSLVWPWDEEVVKSREAAIVQMAARRKSCYRKQVADCVCEALVAKAEPGLVEISTYDSGDHITAHLQLKAVHTQIPEKFQDWEYRRAHEQEYADAELAQLAQIVREFCGTEFVFDPEVAYEDDAKFESMSGME